MKTDKYVVKTAGELEALKKMFNWTELFEMCHFTGPLLTKALAMNIMDQEKIRDASISEKGFKKSFHKNEIIFQN